jgi:drug/metabolite transporter (DMT)-like permease
VSPARPLDARGAILALLLAALWGGNPVAVKLGLADAPPLRLAATRFVLGGLTVLAYAWLTRRASGLWPRRGEWRVISSLGLLFSAQAGLMYVGANLTSAAHGAVLINTYAIHTVLLAHFFIPGDRLTTAKLVGVLVAYAGIVVLFAGDVSPTGGTMVGDLVLAASAFLLGERTVYMARALQRVDPFTLLLGQSAIGCTAFVAGSYLLESAVPTHHTASLGVVLLYQGVVIAGFNYVVDAWLLQRYLPSGLATCMLTTPIFGVLFATAIAGDRLTPALVLSSVMVAAGIGIATRRTA